MKTSIFCTFTRTAPPDAALQQKQMGLVMRLLGPTSRDAELEQRMPDTSDFCTGAVSVK